MTRKPLGPTGQMEKGPQVTHKPSGPTGRMEMEKGLTGTHDMQAVRSNRGPTCWMEKGPSGDFYDKKGPSGDFYDKLPTSRMSNYRSHMYTSDEESSM